MILARGLVRVVAPLLLAVLALVGLAVAAAAIDPGRAADLANLPQLRDTVGGWYDDLGADGPVAAASALGGAAAVVLGLLLLAGLLVPRRERLARMAATEHGTLSARRRPLGQIASRLAEQAPGVTRVRAKVKPGRRHGGSLQVRADRTATVDPGQAKQALTSRLADLAGPFGLKPRVQTRLGERGRRVQ